MSDANKIVSFEWDVKVKTTCLDCGEQFDEGLTEWVKWMKNIGIDLHQKRHTRYQIEFYDARSHQHKEV